MNAGIALISVPWTGNCTYLARSNKLHNTPSLGRGIFLWAASWFRLCIRTHERRSAASRSTIGAPELQCGCRNRSAFFCIWNSTDREMFSYFAIPVASLGRSDPELHCGNRWGFLDDSKNRNPIWLRVMKKRCSFLGEQSWSFL